MRETSQYPTPVATAAGRRRIPESPDSDLLPRDASRPARLGSRRGDLAVRRCAMVPALLAALVVTQAPNALAISTETWRAASGVAGGDRFGWGVGPSCDVNGDGLDDVMVGAPLDDTNGANAGRVAIFYGSKTIAPAAAVDYFLPGQSAGEEFGYALAPAGDVNGDGWPDVIVGAPFNDAGGIDAGRAYVFFMGPNADDVPDLVLTGAAAGDNFGAAVSGAGDMNGDGYADVIVGAPRNDAVGADAGRAYVFFGGATPNSVADLVLSGAAAGDQFGRATGGGTLENPNWDVNGDGYGDVLVGAPLNDAGGADAGRAYVYFGGPSPDATADLVLSGAAAGDQFGHAVGALADFNGDGFGDVLVGALLNDTGGTDTGRAYLFYGGPLADATADLTFSGQGAGDNFGSAVASAGDVNGDGYEDAIVGAPFNDAGGSNAGRAYVFFGGTSPNVIADLYLTGAAANDSTGAAVAWAGDLNGDGHADLVVGSPASLNGTLSAAGRIRVELVYAYRLVTPNGGETWVEGGSFGIQWMGHDVADVALSTDAGRMWQTIATGVGGAAGRNEVRFLCPSAPTAEALVRITQTGQAASRSNSDVSDRAFRIATPTTPPPVASKLRLDFASTTVNDRAGAALASVDFNGDGWQDLLVGAPGGGSGMIGRVLVFYGGGQPDPSNLPDLVLDGLQAGESFGTAVANAGDVNGDGYEDVIVGAPLNNAAGTQAGRAYVFYGGGTPDPSGDLTLTGAAAGDQFGSAVAGGDINHDGFSDLLVGAPMNDAGGADAGRAYVFYGGGNPDPGNDLTVTGTTAGDHFGAAVAVLGKVRELGVDRAFDAFLVAAPLNDEAGLDAGRIYVYEAAALAFASPKLSIGGHAPGEMLGVALAPAADLAGDGSVHFLAGLSIPGIIEPNDRPVGYDYSLGPWGATARALMGLVPPTPHTLETRVADVGDVNGDGFHDAVAGLFDVFLPQDPAFLPKVFLYEGGIQPGNPEGFDPRGVDGIVQPEDLAGVIQPSDRFLPPTPNERFARAVTGLAGPDGFSDIVIGADLSNVGASGGGRVFVHDMNRFHLGAPNGGETWNVGGLQTLSWRGAARADVELSVDGGASWTMLAHNAGGQKTNSLSLRVPHRPTRFARIRISDCEPPYTGTAASESLFTISSSVSLLSFVARQVPGGTELTWASDPPVSAEGLLGYRLTRFDPGTGGAGTRVGPDLITEARYVDRDAVPGSQWRLVAVNGLNEEIELQRGTPSPTVSGLRVWPSPATRGAMVRVAFTGPRSAFGTPATDLDVAVFDVSGRRLATLAHGAPDPRESNVELSWDGRDAGGLVPAGLYFVRASAPSVGFEVQRRLVVIR